MGVCVCVKSIKESSSNAMTINVVLLMELFADDSLNRATVCVSFVVCARYVVVVCFVDRHRMMATTYYYYCTFIMFWWVPSVG